jgi:hypothetical protein
VEWWFRRGEARWVTFGGIVVDVYADRDGPTRSPAPIRRCISTPRSGTVGAVHLALVQIAALVANGNAWLAGDRAAASRVEQGSAFESVRGIRFERLVDSLLVQLATDVEGWYEACSALAVAAFHLQPARYRSVGTMASIVTTGAEPPERWAVSRGLAPPTAAYRGGWLIKVLGGHEADDALPSRSIEDATSDLAATVREARDLSKAWGMSFWSGVLDGALAEAGSDDPQTAAHNDILPPTAELDRRRLFALAVRSWVFGGMGTWSDQGPRDPAEMPTYRRITDALYDRILEGLATAVNPR